MKICYPGNNMYLLSVFWQKAVLNWDTLWHPFSLISFFMISIETQTDAWKWSMQRTTCIIDLRMSKNTLKLNTIGYSFPFICGSWKKNKHRLMRESDPFRGRRVLLALRILPKNLKTQSRSNILSLWSVARNTEINTGRFRKITRA